MQPNNEDLFEKVDRKIKKKDICKLIFYYYYLFIYMDKNRCLLKGKKTALFESQNLAFSKCLSFFYSIKIARNMNLI